MSSEARAILFFLSALPPLIPTLHRPKLGHRPRSLGTLRCRARAERSGRGGGGGGLAGAASPALLLERRLLIHHRQEGRPLVCQPISWARSIWARPCRPLPTCRMAPLGLPGHRGPGGAASPGAEPWGRGEGGSRGGGFVLPASPMFVPLELSLQLRLRCGLRRALISGNGVRGVCVGVGG